MIAFLFQKLVHWCNGWKRRILNRPSGPLSLRVRVNVSEAKTEGLTSTFVLPSLAPATPSIISSPRKPHIYRSYHPVAGIPSIFHLNCSLCLVLFLLLHFLPSQPQHLKLPQPFDGNMQWCLHRGRPFLNISSGFGCLAWTGSAPWLQNQQNCLINETSCDPVDGNSFRNTVPLSHVNAQQTRSYFPDV